jgi:hypothetical protein
MSGRFNDVKKFLITRLITDAPHPVVIGIDGEDESFAAQVRDLVTPLPGKTTVERVSTQNLFHNYGNVTIRYFLGKNMRNAAKLYALERCITSRAGYCWHVEDDVYLRNATEFFSQTDKTSTDFVVTTQAMLPFWVKNRYRVGRARHALPRGAFTHAVPCVYRMSRTMALETRAQISHRVTSHHELIYPYVVHARGLSWSTLPDSSSLHGNTRWERGTAFPNECFTGVDAYARRLHEHAAVHPVKFVPRC